MYIHISLTHSALSKEFQSYPSHPYESVSLHCHLHSFNGCLHSHFPFRLVAQELSWTVEGDSKHRLPLPRQPLQTFSL